MRYPLLEQAYPLSQNQIDFYKKKCLYQTQRGIGCRNACLLQQDHYRQGG